MAFGITKTIPQTAGEAALDALYDGSLREFEFHMAGSMTKVKPGDYVYTIFRDQLHGRCRITRLEPGHLNPCSGKPRTVVVVECPGERLASPLPHRGHQGTRYYDGDGWPA